MCDEPTVVCIVDVAQRAQDLSGLPISLSLRREMLDGIPHFRFVTDPASILMTERSFNILFVASKNNYAGPKPLTKGVSNGETNVEPRCPPHSFGGELGETPKESPLLDKKGLEKGGKSFGEELLDAGYDNGFGVTSLDTLLCEGMSRAQRIDFAAFLMRTAQEHTA